MVTHGEVGLREAGLCHGAKHKPRERVDGVFVGVGRLATDGHVLVHGATGGAVGVRLGANLLHREGFYPKVCEKLQRLALADATRLEVGLVVRIHVLIEAAEGEAMAVGLDLQEHLAKPHGLHGLEEGLGRLVGHLGAGSGDALELGLACWVGGCRSLLGSQLGVAVRPAAHGVDNHEHGLVEGVLVHSLGVGEVEPVLGGTGALLVAARRRR